MQVCVSDKEFFDNSKENFAIGAHATQMAPVLQQPVAKPFDTDCACTAQHESAAIERGNTHDIISSASPLLSAQPAVAFTKKKLRGLRPSLLGRLRTKFRRKDGPSNNTNTAGEQPPNEFINNALKHKLSPNHEQNAPVHVSTDPLGPALRVTIPETHQKPPRNPNSPSQRAIRAANHAFMSVRYFVASCFTASYLWSPSPNAPSSTHQAQPTTWPETALPETSPKPSNSIFKRIGAVFAQKSPKEGNPPRRRFPWSRGGERSAPPSQSAARVFNGPRVDELMEDVMEGLRVATGRKKRRTPKFARAIWKRAKKVVNG